MKLVCILLVFRFLMVSALTAADQVTSNNLEFAALSFIEKRDFKLCNIFLPTCAEGMECFSVRRFHSALVEIQQVLTRVAIHHCLNSTIDPTTVLKHNRNKKLLNIFFVFSQASKECLKVLLTREHTMHIRWLILSIDQPGELLKGLDLPINNMVTFGHTVGKSVQFSEAYRRGDEVEHIQTQVGEWVPSNAPCCSYSQIYMEPEEPWCRRYDLTGIHFRCSLLREPRFVEIIKEYQNGTTKFSGLYYNYVELLRQKMNFTYNCTQPEDKAYGTKDGNGDWNGIIKKILDGSADITFNALDATAERASDVLFLHVLDTTRNFVVIKMPPKFGNSWENYSRGFSPLAWTMTTVATLSMAIIIRLFTKYSPTEPTVQWSEAFLNTFGTLCVQSVQFYPKSMTLKILFVAWLSTSFIIITYYTSVLISSLTLIRLRLPFQTLADVVVRNTPHNILRRNGSSIQFFFQQDEVLRNFWPDRTVLMPGGTDIEKLIQKVAEDKYLVTIVNENEYHTADACEVARLPDPIFLVVNSFAVKKDFLYKEIINCQIFNTIESGVLDNVVKARERKEEKLYCPKALWEPIDLMLVFVVFMAFGFIALLSIVVFILELLIHKRCFQYVLVM